MACHSARDACGHLQLTHGPTALQQHMVVTLPSDPLVESITDLNGLLSDAAGLKIDWPQ